MRAASRAPTPPTLPFPPFWQGGQAQRVQLAIAVALRPWVLLVDEPTSSLDSESAKRVERVLKSCSAALVWVSHDPAQVGAASQAVVSCVSIEK